MLTFKQIFRCYQNDLERAERDYLISEAIRTNYQGEKRMKRHFIYSKETLMPEMIVYYTFSVTNAKKIIVATTRRSNCLTCVCITLMLLFQIFRKYVLKWYAVLPNHTPLSHSCHA